MNIFNATQFVLCGVELAILYIQPQNAGIYIFVCFSVILVLCIPQMFNNKGAT